MNSGPPSEQLFIVSRGRRDATVVIRGYVYQVNTTLLRWIELPTDSRLELEVGEDIDVVREVLATNAPDRIFEAVKHRERNLTLRSAEALSAVATFHEHRQANRPLKLAFRYVTNSAVGSESPAITELGTPGVHIWERIRTETVTGKQKRTLISALRSFLMKCPCPPDLSNSTWDGFMAYLKGATIPELNRFIAAFEWSTGQDNPDELEGRVRYELVNRGKVGTLEQAETAFRHLFHFVFALLSKRSEKVLSASLLTEQLGKCDRADDGRSILSRIDGLEGSLLARFDRLEQEIAPLPADIRDIKEAVARIDQAVHTQRSLEYEQSFDRVSGVGGLDASASPRSTIGTKDSQQSARPLPDVLSAAILAQNEILAATLATQVKDQILAIRAAARRGRRSEALAGIAAQRSNPTVWQVIPNATKAELLRLEAGIRLDSDEAPSRVREILDEAHRIAPDEDDSRLRACLAFWEHDTDAAMSLLEGKNDAESRNLRAMFLLLLQRREESWAALPEPDSDPAIRAETLRIRSLNLLHQHDITGARREISGALDVEPDWPSLQCLAATISFYEGMSVAAIPKNVQAWPEPSSCFYAQRTPDALRGFQHAFAIFDRWAQSSDNSLEEKRLLQMWCLACLAVDPGRRGEAVNFAKQTFAADPGQYRIVPWALAQHYEEVDLLPTEAALRERCASGKAEPLEVIALVMLLTANGDGAGAVGVLDSAEAAFINVGNGEAWHHWRALALATSGDLEGAKNQLSKRTANQETDPLWCEIQRLESLRSGDWDTYAAALRNRYSATGGADALLEYCDFEAHRKNWGRVAERASELIALVGTADALRLAAISTFNDGQPRACLNLLTSRADLVTDDAAGLELHRLRIACNRKVGKLIEARERAEHLCTIAASTTADLLVLAQLQFETGETKPLVLNARKMYQRHDLRPEHALRLAELVKQEDSQLSELLWRKAMTGVVPDAAVGAALNLAYRLGLDRDVGPLLIRMNDLARQGKGGMERKTLDEVIEYATRHQDNVQFFEGLYSRGEIAIHLIPAGIRIQLAVLYHATPAYREDHPLTSSPGVLAVHGGRPTVDGIHGEPQKWRLNIDITSLLLAHHLDLLPKLEHAFAPLRLPPSIFAAIQSMQSAISDAQVSQIEAARNVQGRIDDGEISVDDPPPDPVPADLASVGGDTWARLYQLSRTMNGYLVDFVPKIGIGGSPVPLPGDADERIVNCAGLVEALFQNGSLSPDDHKRALEALGSEGMQPAVGPLMPARTSVLCQATIARLLATSGLLGTICREFRLHILREDAEEIRATLLNHNRSRDLTAWLGALSGSIRQGIVEGTYELLQSGPPEEDREDDLWNCSDDAKCLLELLTFTPETPDVVWADDRYVNAFQRRDSVPIVSIADVLKSLVAAQTLTKAEFRRTLSRLRNAKFYFIPLDTDEILYHLTQAPVRGSALSETPELGTLRRYWSGSLLRGRDLQRPGTFAGNLSGETGYLQVSANAVRDALAALWKTKLKQTEEEREVRAEWLLQTLYVDHLGIRSLTGIPTGEVEGHDLLGVSLGSLIVAGFQMRLLGSCTSAALEAYLRWLHRRVLRRAFERDDRVRQRTGLFIATILRGLWQGPRTREEKAAAARLILNLIEMLPTELQSVLQADEILVRELSIRPTTIVRVGNIQFAKLAYIKAAKSAVNGEAAKARLWRSREEVSFASAAGGVLIRRPSGAELTINDPMLALLSNDQEQRIAALSSRPDWFDCPTDARMEAIARIVRIEDELSRVEEAERWRDCSAAVFYADLAGRLEAQGAFMPDDLRPPDAEALLRYYRICGRISTGTFAAQSESGSDELAKEFGVYQAFVRYSGFPTPLPGALVDRIRLLSETERRKLIKSIVRTAGSPISDIHLLHLLACLAETPDSKYWRLAKRLTRVLINSQQTGRFRAFQRLLHWVDNLFYAWTAAEGWSVEERLAMVWGHTHRLSSAFTYLGVVEDWMAGRFRQPDFGFSRELFEHKSEYSEDISHSQRFSRESFILSGLAYATRGKTHEWWPESIRGEMLSFVRPEVDGERSFAPPLMRDPSLGSNLLGAFLGRDRGELLIEILGEDDAVAFSTETLKILTNQAVKALQETQTTVAGWNGIFWTLGDLKTTSENQHVLIDAIAGINLSPTDLSLEDCQTVLSAASLQTAALKSAAARQHLSSQLIQAVSKIAERQKGDRLPEGDHRFLASLFQIAAHLGWSSASTEEQAAEFARVMDSIMNASPDAASVYRLVLNHVWPCRTNEAELIWPLLVRSRSVDAS
jgi:hypothetical protein